jgi:LVIVD repeat
MRRYLPISLILLLGVQLVNGAASAQIPGTGEVSHHNVHTHTGSNAFNVGGNALDFFERRLADGTLKRYAVAASQNGFDIVDISDPVKPTTVSRYVSLSVQYHPWVQVNGERNIVALSIEEPGRSVGHGNTTGVEFVDISDLATPVLLGTAETAPVPGKRLGGASGLGGPHTIRMIGDNHIYTTLGSPGTHIIDYTNPRNPVDLGQKTIPGLGLLCGHEFYPDPNNTGLTYVGFCSTAGDGKWGILDTSDPANPKLIMEHRDRDIEYAHEAFPAPDSSFVAVGDFRAGRNGMGQTYVRCPGGGIHFYDISGKYKPGASLTNPIKMGTWFAPYTGAAGGSTPVPATTDPNFGPCNLHSLHFQPERNFITVGLYMGGSWIMDPTAATLTTGGEYTEYSHTPGRGLGPTTWGNTKGHIILEGDMVNASQWLPFDLAAAKNHYYTNGLIRGLDVMDYEGAVPKKLSRLTIDGSASGGTVSGVLDRYAVLTHEGWVNKPLAGKTVEIRSGGTTVTATTGADGSFSADLGLSSGTHNVTVTWAGDEEYDVSSLTRQVTA